MDNFVLIHRCKKTYLPYVLYSDLELLNIHQSCGHPSVSSISKLLIIASVDIKLYNGTNDSIQIISQACDIFKKYAGPPRRFELTIGTEDLRFRSSVQIYTMITTNRTVPHMVDAATNASASAFLRNQSAAEILSTIQAIWFFIYFGPPDNLWVYQGSSYISRGMRRNL